jgi:hypothetical protein
VRTPDLLDINSGSIVISPDSQADAQIGFDLGAAGSIDGP